MGPFWGSFGTLLGLVQMIFADFGLFSAHFAHFLPTFKNGFGQRKPSKIKGLRTFCPLSHFFSLLNAKKKINKIYNNGQKKWENGQKVTNQIKSQGLLENFWKEVPFWPYLCYTLKCHTITYNFRTRDNTLLKSVISLYLYPSTEDKIVWQQ